MWNKKDNLRNTQGMLMFYFILFSLLVLLVFYIVSHFFNAIFKNYIVEDIKNYFANGLKTESFSGLDTTKIEQVGGWIYLLDENLNVLDAVGSPPEQVGLLSVSDIVDLTNGNFESNGIKIFGSLKNLDNKKKFIIVCIPADNVKVTYTLSNMPGSIMPFLFFFFLSFAIFACGYVAILILMTKKINSKIVAPIYIIANAMKQLTKGNYDSPLTFKAENEFIIIKEAYNIMINRLNIFEKMRQTEQERWMQLLSDIGHDLRTPVTVIQGFLQAILSEKKCDQEKIISYVQVSFKNTKVLTELINTMLDYTKIGRKDYTIKFTKENLSELLREIIIDNYALCEIENDFLEIDIPEEDIDCMINKEQLKRAFFNIFTNAIFHNKKGTKIKVALRLSSVIQIVCADNGNPIPLLIKDTIFDAFITGDEYRSGTNSGLGLCISKKLIEIHNGTLILEDNWEGYVKAFIITLPKISVKM